MWIAITAIVASFILVGVGSSLSRLHLSHYRPTSEDRAWLLYRLGYYVLQVVLFLLIGFGVGPNEILFGSLLSPRPAYYAGFTPRFVPLIAEIKAYNRDFGRLPETPQQLPREYQPPTHDGEFGYILDTTSITFQVEGCGVLEYEFTPEKEGWIVHSPRYDGPIPAPIVTAAPKPTTRAATGKPGGTDRQ